MLYCGVVGPEDDEETRPYVPIAALQLPSHITPVSLYITSHDINVKLRPHYFVLLSSSSEVE